MSSRENSVAAEQTKHMAQNSSLEKFKTLLNTLFQLDVPELDFGIYRIMNYRRKEIEEFIEKHLIQAVEKEFAIYQIIGRQELAEKLEEKRKEIERLEQTLGEKILKNGEIEEKFKEKPFAKDYLELKKQLEETNVTESVKIQVFNDLYSFFSRYYEDGDFISKRRYSFRQEKYAIPYSGEEVKLHWATADQYYVKTGEVFKNYQFTIKNWRMVFRTTVTEVQVENTKEKRRYFILAEEQPIEIDKQRRTCTIHFVYRQLTDEDMIEYGLKISSGEERKVTTGQDELNSVSQDKILKEIQDSQLKSILEEKENGQTLLEKHLYKYTRKITSDFFVHKNLKTFLERELDYFIKTEVIDLSNLDPRHVTRAKIVEAIGKRIIEFLAQTEEFQKKLWEKKKFVLKTEYVITTDRVPKKFYTQILENKEQLREWKELGFGDIEEKDLTDKKLPVDTRHFPTNFKERLLEDLSKESNIDELVDGVAIKGENFDALRILEPKYRDKVKFIYIDPPYNTGKDEFIYKDNYRHSSWLTMMSDRLSEAKPLLQKDGVIFVSIDDNEMHRLREVMDFQFGYDNRLSDLIWDLGTGTTAGHFRRSHEYILSYSKDKATLPNFGGGEGVIRHGALKRPSAKNPLSNITFPAGIEYEGKEAVFEGEIGGTEPMKIHGRMVFEGGKLKSPVTIDAAWAMKKQILSWLEGKPTYDSKGQRVLKFFFNKQGILWYEKEREKVNPKTVLSNIASTKHGSDILNALFGGSVKFTSYPKPVELLTFLVNLVIPEGNRGDIVLDFFAGSGTAAHAVLNLNRQDEGKRKYILVEIGGWFESVLLPRIKKILFSDNWKDGRPVGANGISHVMKYHILEQYEDTLHNIEFPNEEKGRKVLEVFGNNESGHEYIMKYFLQYETEGSPSLLNVKRFENPFGYKLKMISNGTGEEIVSVDLVETFNYLIGLNVSKYKFTEEDGRKYVFVFGERENRRIAVIWRPTYNINLEKDKELVERTIKDYNPDEVFVNGDSHVEKYKVIEAEFKALMGG
jgi:adenine-specific DNA-methyltransferase